MNRFEHLHPDPGARMPHVCGDEPVNKKVAKNMLLVCPTYVGMNRFARSIMYLSLCMPHVCGDEPLNGAATNYALTYAPRMWG